MAKTKQNGQQIAVNKNGLHENIVCDAYRSDLFLIFFTWHVNIFIVFPTCCLNRVAKHY